MGTIERTASIGEAFEGQPKLMSMERLWAFSGGPFAAEGWPRSNIHTDLDTAKASGLSTVAASGTQFQGHLAQLMIELFGRRWLSDGTMDVRFTRPVDAGETLIARAEVTNREETDGGVRFTFDVSCANRDGNVCLAGTATGIC